MPFHWSLIKKYVYSFVPNCRGDRINARGGKLSRFHKMVGLFSGHSLIIIKWTGGIFSPKLAVWTPPPSPKIAHKRVAIQINSSSKSIFPIEITLVFHQSSKCDLTKPGYTFSRKLSLTMIWVFYQIVKRRRNTHGLIILQLTLIFQIQQ